jgi:hypothetical protein
MKKLRIAIDPWLRERYGPEVCWTWRLILSSAGLPWEEVPTDAPECDIAHVVACDRARNARVWVAVDRERWEQREGLQLRALHHDGQWSVPLFQGGDRQSGTMHIQDNLLLCARDIVFDVFWFATRQAEKGWPRDEHSWFDLSHTPYERESVLRRAPASEAIARFEDCLAEIGFAAPIARWPAGKEAAACVGHDVDYPRTVRWLEPMRVVLRQGPRGLGAALRVLTGHRHHWHFESWVRMEAERGTRSAFYFTARNGSLLQFVLKDPDPFYDIRSRPFRELFRLLADKGAEVALHASYRACESIDRFVEEKRMLEDASGLEVRGNRHHYLRLDAADPDATLLLHERAGLAYDATLHHERYVGWRSGLCWPYFPFHHSERRELRTLQIPTAWMDVQLYRHKGDNPGEPTEILAALATHAHELRGCLLVIIHNCYFDAALHPGMPELFWGLWDRVSSRPDVWVETPSGVAEHWEARYRSILAASRGLADGGADR